MRNKNKFFSILLIMFMIFTFSACDDVDKIFTVEMEKDVGKYEEINNNIPYFSEEDFTTKSFEQYSELDELGRCGVAYACIGQDIMPTEDRKSIGQVKPSGWHTVKYACVDGKYLYNRSHLIGFQLTGENANKENLITGTRFMNTEGMLPFENMVADYIDETNNHVLYRVTPIFKDDNLVASSVTMEALSVEDNGDGICFNVNVFNIQPEVDIDYRTGLSKLSSSDEPFYGDNPDKTYILNIDSKKVHRTNCGAVNSIKEENKRTYQGDIEELYDDGYTGCKICNPYVVIQ